MIKVRRSTVSEEKQKQPKTARDAVTRAREQIREAKRKSYEAQLKKMVEELLAAKGLSRWYHDWRGRAYCGG